jgi:hypothetical protein
MKKISLLLVMAMTFLTAGFWGCGRTPLPTPPPAPTATPTATTAPICSSTIIILPIGASGVAGVVGLSNYAVIRNLTEWQALYSRPFGTSPATPIPIPTPPVNFATQMLVFVANASLCPLSTWSITDVCESSTQVTVSLNDNQPCVFCSATDGIDNLSAVAVPQSNLPVVWNITTIPCSFGSPTPTATP